MLKKIALFILVVSTVELQAQDYYSKEEVDMKLELQQEKINAKLDAVERENNSIDTKMAAQDKQMNYQDKQIETLKFIFGAFLSVIGIFVAVAAFFIDKRNKNRLSEMEEELKNAKDDALKELNRIKDIANLEIRVARAELKEIEQETKSLE